MHLPLNSQNLSTVLLSDIIQPHGDLAFSRALISKNKVLIEVLTVSISTTDDIVLCVLRAEPFGTKTVDFSEAMKFPEPGQCFSIPFSLWVLSPNYTDFTPLGSKVLVRPGPIYSTDSGVRFRRFNEYQASLFFALPVYHLNYASLKFATSKKSQFAYPTIVGLPMFLMRRFFTLFRSKSLGWHGPIELLRSLQFTQCYLFLKGYSTVWGHTPVSGVLRYAVSWQIVQLFRALKTTFPLRLKKKRRFTYYLREICRSNKRIKLISPLLAPADSLRSFSFLQSAIAIAINSKFALFLACAPIPVDTFKSSVCSTFLHYPRLIGQELNKRVLAGYSPLVRSCSISNYFWNFSRLTVPARPKRLTGLAAIRFKILVDLTSPQVANLDSEKTKVNTRLACLNICNKLPNKILINAIKRKAIIFSLLKKLSLKKIKLIQEKRTYKRSPGEYGLVNFRPEKLFKFREKELIQEKLALDKQALVQKELQKKLQKIEKTKKLNKQIQSRKAREAAKRKKKGIELKILNSWSYSKNNRKNASAR